MLLFQALSILIVKKTQYCQSTCSICLNIHYGHSVHVQHGTCIYYIQGQSHFLFYFLHFFIVFVSLIYAAARTLHFHHCGIIKHSILFCESMDPQTSEFFPPTQLPGAIQMLFCNPFHSVTSFFQHQLMFIFSIAVNKTLWQFNSTSVMYFFIDSCVLKARDHRHQSLELVQKTFELQRQIEKKTKTKQYRQSNKTNNHQIFCSNIECQVKTEVM